MTVKEAVPLFAGVYVVFGVIIGSALFPRNVVLPPVVVERVVEVPTPLELPPKARGVIVWPEMSEAGDILVNWLGAVDSMWIQCNGAPCYDAKIAPGEEVVIEVRAFNGDRQVFGENLSWTMPGPASVPVSLGTDT